MIRYDPNLVFHLLLFDINSPVLIGVDDHIAQNGSGNNARTQND